jgi:hypothetical protein
MWFMHLIRSDYSIEERERYWMNTLEHFKGNHAGCPKQHPALGHRPLIQTKVAEDELREILEGTRDLLSRSRHGFDSQMCESFNSVKAKFASKEIAWIVSWSPRVWCAIMQMNSEHNWRMDLAERCQVQLNPNIAAHLNRQYDAEVERNRQRRTEEAQAEERRRRWAVRLRERMETAGRLDYNLPVGDSWITYTDAVRLDPDIAVTDDPPAFDEFLVENAQSREILPSDPQELAGATDPGQPRTVGRFDVAPSQIAGHPSEVNSAPAAPPRHLPRVPPASNPGRPPLGTLGLKEFMRREADQAQEEERVGEEERENDLADDEEIANSSLADVVLTSENSEIVPSEGKELTLRYRERSW